MTNDILKLFFQLVILGIVGGAVTFYYNKLQKNREIIISILTQFSSIHTDFISLRYRFNVLFIISGRPLKNILAADEMDKLKWKYYEESCLLLSKFQSLTPLILKYLPKLKDEIGLLDGLYERYRRLIRSNQPILQSEDGKTAGDLKKLKDLHRIIVSRLADKI